MNNRFIKFLLLFILVAVVSENTFAQQRGRSRRGGATRRTPPQTQASVQTPLPDSTPVVVAPPPPAPPNDSLPYRRVKKSMRRDKAVDGDNLGIPTGAITYEHLREEDAVYRHKIWREIDIREKVNTPFRYAVDEDNGNERFITVLMKALDEDSNLMVFEDDRYTTPLTKAQVAKALAGDSVAVPIYDDNDQLIGQVMKPNEINLDSFYKFRIKEEVIFDKESSRLFWRILGIAPVKNLYTSMGIPQGETEVFWLYYPDFRDAFTNRQAFNAKNYGARINWDDLFESRMFSGRIIKTTMDNPFDLAFKNYKSLQESGILQLMEGERITETIFNYEQDLWSY